MYKLIPAVFFIISMVFNFLDGSSKIFRDFFNEFNFVFGVSLRRMKEKLSEDSVNEDVKKKIKMFVKYRMYHYFFLILGFLSMIIVSFF